MEVTSTTFYHFLSERTSQEATHGCQGSDWVALYWQQGTLRTGILGPAGHPWVSGDTGWQFNGKETGVTGAGEARLSTVGGGVGLAGCPRTLDLTL